MTKVETIEVSQNLRRALGRLCGAIAEAMQIIEDEHGDTIPEFVAKSAEGSEIRIRADAKAITVIVSERDFVN